MEYEDSPEFTDALDRARRDSQDDEELNAQRASKDAICETCHREYWRHPMAEYLSHDGTPYLHRLCCGSLVKL